MIRMKFLKISLLLNWIAPRNLKFIFSKIKYVQKFFYLRSIYIYINIYIYIYIWIHLVHIAYYIFYIYHIVYKLYIITHNIKPQDINRSSCPVVFCKKRFFYKFRKIHKKNLCWMFSCKFLGNFPEHLF